jgi:hypothetical protein
MFVIGLVTLLTAPPAHAQTNVPCAQFAVDFAGLQQQLGAVMGTPTGCPRIDANGDIIQVTSTGLAVHRPDGMSIFASGDDHWALSGDGLEQWTGNWHNGLYPQATPEPDAEATSPALEAQASVQPMRLVQVIQDGTNTVVVEDPSGSMFTVETADGCPDVDAAVGDHVFVRSGGSQTDLILLQQHETCAVAAMHTAPGD